MTSLFSGPPKTPKIPEPIAPPPKTDDAAVQQAAADANAQRQRARGFRSTLLSNMMQSSNPSGSALKANFGS